MLEKTIKLVLNQKVASWLASINDVRIQTIIRDNLIITGGCFTSLIQNEQPKDFDVYFKTREAALEVAKYYVKIFNDNHKEKVNKVGRNKTAIVLTSDMFNIDNDGNVTILDEELAYILGNKKYFVANVPNEEVTDDTYHGLSRMICNVTGDRIKIYINSDGISGSIDEITNKNSNSIENGADIVDVINSNNTNNTITNDDGHFDLSSLLDDADNINSDMLNENNNTQSSLSVSNKYRPVFLSSNAITLTDGIQIVVRFFGEPSQIHDTYDFVHTKAYWTSYENKVVIPREVYEAVMNKALIYTGSKYPLCTIVRMRKFIKRGWNINAGQILKICFQISNLDLTNIDVLEDQLIGVDSLYFTQLINQFRDSKFKNQNFTIDETYVVSIIDKIF